MRNVSLRKMQCLLFGKTVIFLKSGILKHQSSLNSHTFGGIVKDCIEELKNALFPNDSNSESGGKITSSRIRHASKENGARYLMKGGIFAFLMFLSAKIIVSKTSLFKSDFPMMSWFS